MSNDDRIRFDQAYLEDHAEEYCRKELDLSRELVSALRNATVYAPIEYQTRTRKYMNEADRFVPYFSKMHDELIKVGQLVEATSRSVLERLEDAEDVVKTLLQ